MKKADFILASYARLGTIAAYPAHRVEGDLGDDPCRFAPTANVRPCTAGARLTPCLSVKGI